MKNINPKKGSKLFIVVALACLLASMPQGYADTETADTIVYGVLSGDGALSETYVVTVSEKQGSEQYTQSAAHDYVLPWRFSFEYALGGEVISPDLLGGKNGALTLSIKIEENKEAVSTAFSKFGLQLVISMPVDSARNIVAPGAALVYKGNERQIIYTLLPGENHVLQVSCDVQALEMAPIYITAMPMSLSLDLPNTSDTKAKIAALKMGAEALTSGSALLSDASATFLKSLIQLRQGANAMQASLTENLSKGQEVAVLQQSNTEFISLLKAQAAQLEEQMAMAPPESLMALKGQYQQVLQTIGLIEANQMVIASQSEALVSVASGTTELAKGISALSSGMVELDQGIKDLHRGAAELSGGILQSEMAFEDLFAKLERMQALSDTSKEAPSGVPIQYVLRTPAVHVAEVTVIPTGEVTDTLSFWERILRLLGLR